MGAYTAGVKVARSRVPAGVFPVEKIFRVVSLANVAECARRRRLGTAAGGEAG